MTTYVLGGGCFWCLDAVFRQLRGVTGVISGYAGGTVETPTYLQVSSGRTGHAEVVQVTFDETALPSDVLLDIFFSLHDPTTLNRQGADVGTQYRSIMLYTDDRQRAAFIDAMGKATQYWHDPITTELAPLDTFYPAEDEHQDYFANNPSSGYCTVVINPKLAKLRDSYRSYLASA